MERELPTLGFVFGVRVFVGDPPAASFCRRAGSGGGGGGDGDVRANQRASGRTSREFVFIRRRESFQSF